MKSQLAITFVTDTYSPQINGVATTLNRLVSGLRERGHEVDVVRPTVLACEEAGMQVPSVSFPGYREVQIGIPMGMIFQYRWSRKRPDVIYVATESPLGASAIRAARYLKIPAGSGFHTNFQKYVAHYGIPLLGDATMKYLRHVHNRSDRTFVPSYDAIAELEANGFRNLELLPKGVDTALFKPSRRDALLRASWGVSGNTPVGLYVGRLAPEKNLPLAIRAFSEIKKRFPDFQAVLVGDGPMKESLQKEHPEMIFAGFKKGEELAAYYASADVFLFPSMTETFGNVTLEAMASGLQVVAFDYAAARHHIEDGVHGRLAPFGDEDGFVQQSLAIVGPETDHEAMREAARKKARKVRWKKVVRRFEKSLVHMILQGGGGGEKPKAEVPSDYYECFERGQGDSQRDEEAELYS